MLRVAPARRIAYLWPSVGAQLARYRGSSYSPTSPGLPPGRVIAVPLGHSVSMVTTATAAIAELGNIVRDRMHAAAPISAPIVSTIQTADIPRRYVRGATPWWR